MNVPALKGLTNWSGRRGGIGISVVTAMIEIYKEAWGHFEKRHLILVLAGRGWWSGNPSQKM